MPDNNGAVRVRFDRKYMRAVIVKDIAPQPRDVQVTADQLVYVFSVLPSDQPVVITFVVEPEQFGSLSGRIGMPDHQPLRFHQFIYP
jgi:hypothetical protein